MLEVVYLIDLCFTPLMPSTPRVQLDLLLLAALADEPAHGYALIERVRLRSANVLEMLEGSVYPALHRLEVEGLVASEWVPAKPRRRRQYEITSRGRAALSAHVQEWRRVTSAVESVIGVTA